MIRWRIATIRNTDISIHPIVPIYLLYSAVIGHGQFMLIALVSILLHEAAHALVATCFGQPPRSIELTPLGAVMRLEDEARLPPFRRALMLLAGPGMTLLLCWSTLALSIKGVFPLIIGRMIFLSNLSILIMNLLPALPLDGGRLLTLVLASIAPMHLVHRIMRRIGRILGIGLILLNVYTSWRSGGWNLSLAFAGCCLLYSSVVSTTSQAMAELCYLMDRKIAFERKNKQTIHWLAVTSTMPLHKLVRVLPADKMVMFVGVEVGTMKLCGWLSESEVVQHYLRQPNSTYAEVVKFHPDRIRITQNSTI